MNWNRGYTAVYYITEVDPITWSDKNKHQITGGSLSLRSSDTRESAQIDCVNYKPDGEVWIRAWLDARQGDNIEHVPIFTGLAVSPKTKYQGRLATCPLECYSVLQPAKDIWLQRGWYAPVGVRGGTIIKQLLSVTPAPVIVHGQTPELKDSLIAEDGESMLSMTEKILNAIGWRIRISGNGEIHLMEKSNGPVKRFGQSYDILEKSVEIETDFYSCPNVFIAIDDDVSGIAKDNSGGQFSIQARGREIWKGDTDCKLSENETVAEYALRKLKELQHSSVTLGYSRRFDPDVRVGDVVYIQYPAQGVDGKYEVQSQSIELGYGATVQEVTHGI